MRETQLDTGLPIHIYGPETHITAIVPLALGLAKIEEFPEFDDERHQMKTTKLVFSRKSCNALNDLAKEEEKEIVSKKRSASVMEQADITVENFTAGTRCFVYGTFFIIHNQNFMIFFYPLFLFFCCNTIQNDSRSATKGCTGYARL
jgi:ATP citrate (pro-S)-lyase